MWELKIGLFNFHGLVSYNFDFYVRVFFTPVLFFNRDTSLQPIAPFEFTCFLIEHFLEFQMVL
jgi:hypothetical protein